MSSSLTTLDTATDSFSSGPLPEDYQPTENTVVLGRGKRIKELPGNRRLAAMVQDSLGAYSWADKTVKSSILMRIVNRIRDLNEHQVGFVKQDNKTKRWYEASTLNARTTVAQVFRDANHGCYRSSKQSKQVRRRMELAQDNTTMTASDDASFVPPPPAFMRAITAEQAAATMQPSFQREQSLTMNMGQVFPAPLAPFGLTREVSMDAITNNCTPFKSNQEPQQANSMGEFANSLRFLKQQQMHLQRQLVQSNMHLNGAGNAARPALMRFGSLLGQQQQQMQQQPSRSTKVGAILDDALDMLNDASLPMAPASIPSLDEWNVDEEELAEDDCEDELLMIDPLPISEEGAFDAFLDDGLDVLDEVPLDDMRQALGVSLF